MPVIIEGEENHMETLCIIEIARSSGDGEPNSQTSGPLSSHLAIFAPISASQSVSLSVRLPLYLCDWVKVISCMGHWCVLSSFGHLGASCLLFDTEKKVGKDPTAT